MYSILFFLSLFLKGSPTLKLVRKSTGSVYLDGFLGEVMRLLQNNLHFRLQLSQEPGFGNQLANGSWIGLVGVVARKVSIGLEGLKERKREDESERKKERGRMRVKERKREKDRR